MTETGPDPVARHAAPRERAKHVALVLAKTGVSIGLLWALFANYDFAGTLARLAAIDPLLFAVAVGGEFISIVGVTLRWLLILGAIEITPGFMPALGIVFIGLFFNQALPSNLGGDAMRVWRLFRTGSALGRAVGSVMLDRIIALITLAMVVALGLLMSPGLIGDPAALSALWGVIGLVGLGTVALLTFDKLLLPLRRILPDRVVGAGSALARDARASLLDARRGPAVILVSSANHLLTVTLIYLLALGLGIEVALVQLVALVPPVILISMLPISFAGWGVREGAMVASLAYAGVPADGALALSVAFGVVVLISSLPGAAVWFITGNRMRKGAPRA
jgi:uncharacterized membrane protein YbhN (UPF0104 family)